MTKRIIIIFLLFFTVMQEGFSQERRRGHNWFTDNIIYGRNNAPDNIYYKYIENNQSELFFYSLLNYKDIHYNDNTILIIIPYQSNEGILLYYVENTNYNYIHQYFLESSIDNYYIPFRELGLAFIPKLSDERAKMSFSSENLPFNYLLNQFELEYHLISKRKLLNMFDEIFTINVAVSIEKTTLDDPAYAQEP